VVVESGGLRNAERKANIPREIAFVRAASCGRSNRHTSLTRRDTFSVRDGPCVLWALSSESGCPENGDFCLPELLLN
jgi:hypothetical protein